MSQLVEQPINELDRKYASFEGMTASQELDALLRASHNAAIVGGVSDEIVRAFHSKVRGRECEATLWNAVLFRLRAPLPPEIAHDLIDRDIVVGQLGHTRQKDDVQWRLASLVDEALLTFVWDMFTQALYPAAEFEKLLFQHPGHVWLLDKWEHWALLSSKIQDEEKEVLFHRWAWEHPERSNARSEVPPLERYLEILEERRQKQQRIEREAEEERQRVEQEDEQRRIELRHLSQRPLMEEEIRGMFWCKTPTKFWLWPATSICPFHGCKSC